MLYRWGKYFCLFRLIDLAVRNELGPYLARRPLPTVADDHARCQIDNAEIANPQEKLRTSPLHDAASDEQREQHAKPADSLERQVGPADEVKRGRWSSRGSAERWVKTN